VPSFIVELLVYERNNMMNTRNNRLLWIRVAAVLAAALFGYVPGVYAAAPASGWVRQAPHLTVTQTAQASFTRTHQWSLTNAAAPTVWHLMDGDEAVSRFTVQLVKIGQKDSGWMVSGKIHIVNSTPSAATLAGVTETISSGSRQAAVVCPVTFPYRLASGKTLDCTYTARLSGAANGSSQVRVRTTGQVVGSTAAAAFTFGQPTREVNASVQVSAGGQNHGPYTGNASFVYEKTFACTNPGTQSESALIVETGQASQAQVQVLCSGLEYAQSMQTYPSGDGWGVKGSLKVNNSGGADMWVAGVRDLIGPDLEAVVDCAGANFSGGPYRLAAGGVLSCTFQHLLPDQTDRWNYARITIQTGHFNPDGTRTPNGSSDYVTDPDPLSFTP
jgi:hypothetical protein